MKESNPKMSKNMVLKEHNKTFLHWFKDTIFADDSASEMLIKLADGPKRNVITWQGYDIKKYSFYTSVLLTTHLHLQTQTINLTELSSQISSMKPK